MLPPKSLASLKRQVGLKLCALRLNISPLGRVGAAQKGGDICIHIVDSLCDTAENNIVHQLYSN